MAGATGWRYGALPTEVNAMRKSCRGQERWGLGRSTVGDRHPEGTIPRLWEVK